MKSVLFVSHKEKRCGVYQWGERSSRILKNMKNYDFHYCEVDSETDFKLAVISHNPEVIIYNYHPATMPWLCPRILDEMRSRRPTVIIHEGFAQADNTHSFDYYIYIDPEMLIPERWDKKVFKVGRPLLPYYKPLPVNKILTIGSFGFGFSNKRYEQIVRQVNKEFDEATINLLIPLARYGDDSGMHAYMSANKCRREVTKAGIVLNIYHDFRDELEVLDFLAGNDLNAFFFEEMLGRGMSSSIDYALSVRRPIAVTDTYMFRHITKDNKQICIENNSLKDILGMGTKPLEQFYSRWTDENYIKDFERILDEITNQPITYQ